VKFFICSDIHGNERALDAVLDLYRKESPCTFLFLGDCVGYGPHPDACLEKILDIPQSHLVMGNHEWALLDRSERIHLNPLAAKVLNWSEDLLQGRYDEVIRNRFQIEVDTDSFLGVHGSPVNPEEWPYLFSYIDADEAFSRKDFRLCFVGHTHIPVMFTFKEGNKIMEGDVTFRLDPGDRYIINPGSVGQPRDLDFRAACCIFDSDEGTITLHRCEYDVEAEVQDFEKAGLPTFLGERLLYGM